MGIRCEDESLGLCGKSKARVVARGDKQRPIFDIKDNFSPVARMVTSRIFRSVRLIRDITMYQGDTDTVYLDSNLGIKQYPEGVEGYPREDKGMIYIIYTALYGLLQSRRELNSEVNHWVIDYGF